LIRLLQSKFLRFSDTVLLVAVAAALFVSRGDVGARTSAIDPGVASGSLVVKAETIALKHAYAFLCDNAEGMLDGPELRILLSDRELEDDVLVGWNSSMRLQPLVEKGAVRGVLLKLDPANATAQITGTLLYPSSSPGESLIFFSSKGNNELKKFQNANNRVVGEAEYESKPSEASAVPSFKFSVSFSAPLFRDQDISARLTGPSAGRSAPAQALLGFERAVREGSLDLAKTMVTNSKWLEIEAHRAQVGDAQFRLMVKQLIPTTPVRSAQIGLVIIRNTRATILITEGGSKTAFSLVQEQGKWKVD
jgi:hypothetical protein